MVFNGSIYKYLFHFTNQTFWPRPIKGTVKEAKEYIWSRPIKGPRQTLQNIHLNTSVARWLNRT